MHAVRQDQELQAVIRWAAIVLTAGGILVASGKTIAVPLQVEPDRKAENGNKPPKENPAARRNKKRAPPGLG